MTLEQQIPTINEIAFNAIDANVVSLYNGAVTYRPNRFRVGQRVKFFFNGRTLQGNISNTFCRNGVCTYHIVTTSGGWYREIEQENIAKV